MNGPSPITGASGSTAQGKEPNPSTHARREEILCVDLDGTITKTDMLFESVAALLRTSPLKLLAVPFLLLRGRAYLKSWLAARCEVQVALLPYNSEFVEFLEEEHRQGRQLVLASASDLRCVKAVADFMKIFSRIIASDGKTNKKSRRKVAAIRGELEVENFGYAGDSRADLAVWRAAQSRIVVSSDDTFVRAVTREFPDALLFPGKPSISLATIARSMRVHQWVKNLLIFVPMVMAHLLMSIALWRAAVLAFVSFGAAASAVYILNDLVDLEADRSHRSKRHRPFAAGALPISVGLLLVPVLFTLACAIAALLPTTFLWALLTYLALTSAYTFWLKRVVVVDIVVLAGLYALRVLAGGFAVGVPVSQWLLAFSMFLFLSLAALKRYSELLVLRRENREKSEGRGYWSTDLEQIAQLGGASGYISVLVLALYINSTDVAKLYTQPTLLWLTCPILLYWISRAWLLAHRGEMHDDPILFALRDRVSYIVGGMACAVLWLAM